MFCVIEVKQCNIQGDTSPWFNLLLTSKQMFRIGLACPDLARPKWNYCFDVNRKFVSTGCVTLYVLHICNNLWYHIFNDLVIIQLFVINNRGIFRHGLCCLCNHYIVLSFFNNCICVTVHTRGSRQELEKCQSIRVFSGS